jgi:hypothetical protein
LRIGKAKNSLRDLLGDAPDSTEVDTRSSSCGNRCPLPVMG